MPIVVMLVRVGLIPAICYLATIISKCVIAFWIIKNPTLSDEKAKAITKMMSKDTKYRQ